MRLRAEALQRASAQAGRHFAVLAYWRYAPRVKNKCVPLRDELSREALRDLASYSRPFLRHGSGQDWMTFLIIPVGYWH
jgi:hypothetical protein